MENRLEIIISSTCTCFTLILIHSGQKGEQFRGRGKHKNMDTAGVLQAALVTFFTCFLFKMLQIRNIHTGVLCGTHKTAPVIRKLWDVDTIKLQNAMLFISCPP